MPRLVEQKPKKWAWTPWNSKMPLWLWRPGASLWAMWDGGDRLTDYGPNGNHASPVSSAPKWEPGQLGMAIDMVEAASSPTSTWDAGNIYAFTDSDFTLTLVFQWDSDPGANFRGVCGRWRDSGTRTRAITLFNDGATDAINFFTDGVGGGNTQHLSVGPTVSGNVGVPIVFSAVMRGNTKEVYHFGVQTGTQALTTNRPLQAFSTNLKIGGHNDTSLDGKIYFLHITPNALSQGQIQGLHRSLMQGFDLLQMRDDGIGLVPVAAAGRIMSSLARGGGLAGAGGIAGKGGGLAA